MGRRAKQTVAWGKRAIEQLPTPRESRATYSHKSITGLSVVVTGSGRRTFYFRYWLNGRQERERLGEFPAMTPQAALDRVGEIARVIATGQSPADKRRKDRASSTLREFWHDRFLPHLAHAGRRPRTIGQYRDTWKNHIGPALGHKKLNQIKRRDVLEMHEESGARAPRAANLALAVLRSALNYAVDREILEANPCDRIRKHPERPKERHLSPAEIARLYQVLASEPDRDLHDVIKLALLTGARRGNLLSMRWQDINLPARLWTVPQAQTKTGKTYVISLTPEAAAILQRRAEEAEDGAVHVFPGRVVGQPISNIKRGWTRVRAAAGLEDVRFHDLRHTLASLMINAGASLPVVGKQLGHANNTTTSRYAHLVQDTVADAVERATAGLEPLRDPLQIEANVTPVKK